MIEATRKARITIGNQAGWRFKGQADLVVAYHCERKWSDGRIEHGFFVRRKWLVDRAAFNYDPTLGWATECWFEWNGEI
jgi:hypothetical protein